MLLKKTITFIGNDVCLTKKNLDQNFQFTDINESKDVNNKN